MQRPPHAYGVSVAGMAHLDDVKKLVSHRHPEVIAVRQGCGPHRGEFGVEIVNELPPACHFVTRALNSRADERMPPADASGETPRAAGKRVRGKN